MTPKIAIGIGHYPDEPKKEIEYPANQKTAELLHSMLVVNGSQAEVFGGELPTKVRSINQYEADIALDIHYNAMGYPYDEENCGDGYEVLVWPTSTFGKALGRKILEGFEEKIPIHRRGTGLWERKDLFFLKHTKMPAVIPEPLFLDNPIEANFLKTKRGYEFVATALYLGITNYFKDRNQ